jgi:hypothetical protein
LTTAPLWLLTPSGQSASGAFIDDTLKLRAQEQGMLGRLTGAGDFPRQRVEVVRGADPAALVNELYYRRGWTDGLPIVAPTLERVDGMLASVALGRNASLGELDPLRGVATIEKVAANAVMAGCVPVHFPLVVAAVRALVLPEFNLRGVQTTDENVAPVLIVSSPQAAELDLNDGFGALGPGWRGNAAIGRAVRFVMNNIGGGWPAAVSMAGLGQPARYTLCFAENESLSPWPALRVEHGFREEQTVLTVLRAESVINVTGGAEEIASVMGSAASAFSMAHGGIVTVILSPYTANRLAERGLSKGDVKAWLYERGRVPRASFETFWLKAKTMQASRWPDWIQSVDANGPLPVVESPENITLVVAGANIAISQQAYLPTWGFPDCRIHQAIN